MTTLILDNNNIKNLKKLSQCPSVDTLWLNNNKIQDIKSLMDQISRLFPNLTYLSLLRNPCTPDMYFSEDEGEAYQRFRYYVIHRLPTLTMLDATEIDQDEKNKAVKIGHLMIAARPDNENDQSSGDDDDEDKKPNNQPKQYSIKNLVQNAPEPKVSTFLVRSKPRYDGTNSEGNRFITNDDL